MAWVSIRAALGLALRVIALLVLLLAALRAPAAAAGPPGTILTTTPASFPRRSAGRSAIATCPYPRGARSFWRPAYQRTSSSTSR